MKLIVTRIGPVSLLLIGALLVSCTTTVIGEEAKPSAPPMRVSQRQEAFVRERVYEIQAGDRLDIKFYYNPELNETDLPVRPDGRISLQLIGEVSVRGLTPGALRDLLKKKYEATELRDVEVAVIVRSFGPEPPPCER